MKWKTLRQPELLRSALGAAIAVLCGLLLWLAPFGDAWVNHSYDYLFGFGSRSVTNRVSLIRMDNAALDQFHQTRSEPWDRALHAQLLNKLADDGCAMVVFDSFFRSTNDAAADAALVKALRRQRAVVLMAWQAEVAHPNMTGARPVLPAEIFLEAARTNWGVAWLDPDLDSIVRHQWPFPSPGPYPSLAWTTARLAGAQLSEEPRERWLRYYGQHGPWTSISYKFALSQPANYFRDQVVFIGNWPATTLPGDEPDEFRTPYTLWTGESTGGVEIMITSFLNLLNGESLQRPAAGIELAILIVAGILLGGGLCRMRFWRACVVGVAVVALIATGAIYLSYAFNYWFPWLVIAGGQAPCALAWAALVRIRRRAPVPVSGDKAAGMEVAPVVPGYELFHPPFGEGAYGKVWLAMDTAGQWRAVKVVYRANFGQSADPYEREYSGITRYKPLSDQHPGLLRVDFVSEQQDGSFYYVMELGDSLVPNWQRDPAKYKPRDLISERAQFESRRLPARECIRVGLALIDALEFLHQHGVTHRDIKPQNIIFVNGKPKLADLGLITEIRPEDKERTFVGTPGYMPPPPELPGTPQADIYALGMVLYVLSTGRSVMQFPEIGTSLVEEPMSEDFRPLNTVILKACHPTPKHRFASAAEMRSALQEAQNTLPGQ